MRSCPVCRLFLAEREWQGSPRLVCASCGGVWLDGPAFDSLASVANSPLPELDTLSPGTSQPSAFEGLLRLCPDCKTTALELTAVESLGREIHRCPKCRGVWWQPRPPASPAPSEPPHPLAVAESAATPSPAAAAPTVLDEEHGITVDVPDRDTGPILPLSLSPAAPELGEIQEEPVHGPDDAWKRLVDGNARFAAGLARHPRSSPDRASEVVTGQHPFAVVVCCSDSRVPPEIVFDQGIGDLFVVRSAGHVLASTTMASILYAVDHLHVPLVVVLGHSDCGAVTAAVRSSGSHPTYLEPLLRVLRPAAELAAPLRGDAVWETVRIHAARSAERVSEAIGSNLPDLPSGRVQVVSAVYDLRTCLVERLPDTPKEPKPAEAHHPQAEPASDHSLSASRPEAPPIHADAAAELTPPGDAVASRYPRWCPRCRGGFGAQTALCPRCGVVLVQPWYRVPCLKCKKDNLIGLDRCWNCRADLHPDWLVSGGRAPSPPKVSLRPVITTQRDGSQGCSTSIVLWAGVVALGYALLTRLL